MTPGPMDDAIGAAHRPDSYRRPWIRFRRSAITFVGRTGPYHEFNDGIGSPQMAADMLSSLRARKCGRHA